jgi:hypothetical protein
VWVCVCMVRTWEGVVIFDDACSPLLCPCTRHSCSPIIGCIRSGGRGIGSPHLSAPPSPLPPPPPLLGS